ADDDLVPVAGSFNLFPQACAVICRRIEFPSKFTDIRHSQCKDRNCCNVDLLCGEVGEAFVADVIVGELTQDISGIWPPQSDTTGASRDISHGDLLAASDLIT